MNTILVDHDIEGQVLALWGFLAAEGWPARIIHQSEKPLRGDGVVGQMNHKTMGDQAYEASQITLHLPYRQKSSR